VSRSTDSPLRHGFRLAKRWLKSRVGLDVFVRPRCSVPIIRLGSGPGMWSVCPEGLDRHSVVYSFGVGRDISFERAMIERFGLTVHAFDPTPMALGWIKSQGLPAGFVLHEIGIADRDGSAVFQPPAKAKFESYSLVRTTGTGNPIEAPVSRFTTIAGMLGHRRVDVVKMDIEGAEYQVLENILESGVEIEQILIEFHHRWKEVGAGQTRRALHQLDAAGFTLADVSASGMEYTFVAQGSRTSRT
jgi:FkbM family methyltransferase